MELRPWIGRAEAAMPREYWEIMREQQYSTASTSFAAGRPPAAVFLSPRLITLSGSRHRASALDYLEVNAQLAIPSDDVRRAVVRLVLYRLPRLPLLRLRRVRRVLAIASHGMAWHSIA